MNNIISIIGKRRPQFCPASTKEEIFMKMIKNISWWKILFEIWSLLDYYTICVYVCMRIWNVLPPTACGNQFQFYHRQRFKKHFLLKIKYYKRHHNSEKKIKHLQRMWFRLRWEIRRCMEYQALLWMRTILFQGWKKVLPSRKKNTTKFKKEHLKVILVILA